MGKSQILIVTPKEVYSMIADPVIRWSDILHRESKKQDTQLLAITSPNIIRVLQIFH